MNLLGHIRVARGQANDPTVWLGAALPDLQREAGVGIGDQSHWITGVVTGIECHRVADATFHDLDVFRTQSLALNRALQHAGLPRGPARAIAHAGWEILLDGALVDDATLVDAYRRAMSLEVAVVAPGLDEKHASQWRRALAMRVERGAPRLYADPVGVAELLWRVLGRRRLLAFDRSHMDAVTACLADAQPAIVDAAPEVFAALTGRAV